MIIDKINNLSFQPNKKVKSEEPKDVKNKEINVKNQDRFEFTSKTQKEDENKLTTKGISVEEVEKLEQQRKEKFQQMITKMLGKQANLASIGSSGKQLSVTQSQTQQAQKSIEPGGEWSVDAVATRIMDMAKALSGGDSSKAEMLREAVQKGFEQAQGVFGNEEMPEITGQTYNEVMKRFDEWIAE